MSGNIVAGYEESEMWKIFDAAADEVISRRDFEKWLVALGAFRNKPELQDAAGHKLSAPHHSAGS